MHGFAAISVSEPAAAIDAVCLRPPDLVLLDWSMPERVLYVVQRERAQHGFALIALRPDGSRNGGGSLPDPDADDWVSPPLVAEEMSARLQVLLQKRERGVGSILVCDDLRIDVETRQATFEGRRLRLSDVQLRLLEFFVHHQGKLCQRELLLRRVWASDHQPALRTVDVNVQRLRQLLRASGCQHHIETIRGGGYRFTPSAPFE